MAKGNKTDMMVQGIDPETARVQAATVVEANKMGFYCGTLSNGDTFGDEDDTTLDLWGRKI